MGRCIPKEVTGTTKKTHPSDKTGEKVVVAPCKCLTFDEVKALIKANNIDMPRPNNLNKSEEYTVYKVPDELIMAIIAVESKCEGNKYIGKGGKLIDIEFDPCAFNKSSHATGLSQIIPMTMLDFILRGLVPGTATNKDACKKLDELCGNAALEIKYCSWNVQLKYFYRRNLKENEEEKFIQTVANSGTTERKYGTDRIYEMKLLQKNYTKETIIEYKNSPKK